MEKTFTALILAVADPGMKDSTEAGLDIQRRVVVPPYHDRGFNRRVLAPGLRHKCLHAKLVGAVSAGVLWPTYVAFVIGGYLCEKASTAGSPLLRCFSNNEFYVFFSRTDSISQDDFRGSRPCFPSRGPVGFPLRNIQFLKEHK